MSDTALYEGREQTLIKHLILRKYLERFAHKVGSRWGCVTYVDCFAGPWNAQSSDFRDSSFSIAIRELRVARSTLAARGRRLRLRCFFLEKDPSAYRRLAQFSAGVKDVEIQTHNGELAEAVGDILRFIIAGGTDSFPFIFIDPTGWTGFAMATIAPLLKHQPVEVLINFMTGHILRFLDSPLEQTQQSFQDLFGSPDCRERIASLPRSEREDEALKLYSENVRRVGGFAYVCNATVLHPEKNRTHFNLIYATRHPEGVSVFKESERRAMREMERARAEARQRKRVGRDRQSDLFCGDGYGGFAILRSTQNSLLESNVATS